MGSIFKVFIAISIYFSIRLTNSVWANELESFDERFQHLLARVFVEETHPFFDAISTLGSKQGIGVVAILALIWLWAMKRDYVGMIVLVLAVGLGNEVNGLIKDLVGRERPSTAPLEDLHSMSFPSGHAMVGLVLYMLIAYFIIKDTTRPLHRVTIGVITGLLIFLIGISRLVLLAHYPSDVWAGFSFGFIWASLAIIVYKFLLTRRKTT